MCCLTTCLSAAAQGHSKQRAMCLINLGVAYLSELVDQLLEASLCTHTNTNKARAGQSHASIVTFIPRKVKFWTKTRLLIVKKTVKEEAMHQTGKLNMSQCKKTQ